MGLIQTLAGLLFGSRNVVRETAEVFRENAEAAAARASGLQGQVLAQYAAEFALPRPGWFDRLMDGLNRLPRPALALGTLALFAAAMVDPLWFAARMQGIALVPEPLWWLLGVIVTFYFGARHQLKSQDFQREIATTMARVPAVLENLTAIAELRHDSPGAAGTGVDATLTLAAGEPSDNPALDAWRAQRRA
ncbi:holin family protein [Seohaeicola nanhaiensis]|uniref:Holin family protein n=1 Tax=Seohaeicola nanhaiensis TaxID=1387282 RepID=A0ABV9KFH1_9RHOB